MAGFGQVWRRIAFFGLVVAAICRVPVQAQSAGEEGGGLWNHASGTLTVLVEPVDSEGSDNSGTLTIVLPDGTTFDRLDQFAAAIMERQRPDGQFDGFIALLIGLLAPEGQSLLLPAVQKSSSGFAYDELHRFYLDGMGSSTWESRILLLVRE